MSELEFLKSQISGYENVYEDNTWITFQFPTEAAATEGLGSIGDKLDSEESEEDSAYFVSFLKEDVKPLVSAKDCAFLENKLAKKHEEIAEAKMNTTAIGDEKHIVKLVSYTQFGDGEIEEDNEILEKEFDSLDKAEEWAEETNWGTKGHYIEIYIDGKLWGRYTA